MNLFKKTTASVALVALVSGTFSTGVAAMDLAEINAATSLAQKGFINEVETVADFRLDATITRAEAAKVAAMIAGVTPNDSCEGKFTDVSATTPNDWVCGYVEALLEEGLLSANAEYNPERNLSKTESLKMMMEAAGEEVEYGNDWQADFVAHAVEAGYISTFADFNTAATRGFVFVAADNSHTANNDDDLLEDILDQLEGGEDEDNGEDTDTEEPVVIGDEELVVTLSPNTVESATIPRNIDGLSIASYDLTAGSKDVTVNAVTVKRSGLSDKNTLDNLAVFTSKGRVSKAKDDSQENDTQAYINLDNGGLVVKAGETVTMNIVADITGSTSDEFRLELIEVDASSSVELSNAKSNTLRIGAVEAAQVTIKQGSNVSDVKAGDNDVEIFKFEVEGADDRDVELKTITFKNEGSVDAETELEDYKLEYNGKEIASTMYANDDYVTFNIEGGVVIREDKTENFTVTADVIGGVTETIEFVVDKTLDVSAVDSRYGYGASVDISDVDDSIDSVLIEAGELTLSDFDAPSDKIRADKDNVELGSIEVTNVSGQELELQKFGVNVTLTNNGTGTLADTFENFEAVINGQVFELDEITGGYEDDAIDVMLSEGKTTIVLRADTKEDVANGVTVTMNIDDINSQFYVEETEDDNQVEDITPSSLSFKSISFIDSGAIASSTPLSNVSVVRGAEEIVAAQFEVEAEEASMVTVDEVDVVVTASGAAATNKQITEVALYKGSVSESNLLDKVSGTKIASNGTVNFDGFRTDIAADSTETFVVTVGLVDGADVSGRTIEVSVTAISAEDDEFDDVTVANLPLASNKEIVVTESWDVSIAYDAENEDNDENKTILAGDTAFIASYDVQAQNEKADIENVKFTLSDTTSASRDAIKSAKLYLDDKLVATTLSKDILAGNAVKEVSTITVNTAATTGGNLVLDVNGEQITANLSQANPGVAEVSTLQVTATDAGNILVILDGTAYQVTLPGTGVNDDAAAIQATIDALDDYSATVSTDTVTITAANVGSQTDIVVANTTATTFAATLATTTDGEDEVTASTNASKIAAAVNAGANSDATVNGAVVTVTAKNGGTQTDISEVSDVSGVDTTVAVSTQGTGSANTTIEFDNLTNLIVDTESQELKLAIETNNIGYELVGQSIQGITVDSVVLSEVEGFDSGKTIGNASELVNASKEFTVVAGVITPSNVQTLSSSSTQAKLKLSLAKGNNKKELSNASPEAVVKTLKFSTPGEVTGATIEFKLYEEGKSSNFIAANSNGNTVTFTLTDDTNGFVTANSNKVSTNKTYVIVPTVASGETASLTLVQDGVVYDIVDATNVTSNLSSELDFGSRTVSN